jgi:hypothetical protein
MKRLPIVLLILAAAAACQAPPGRGPAASAPIIDGPSLISAMHARYADTCYRRLRVRQEVIFHDEAGAPTRREVWTELIELPGKVRSIIGDEDDGDGELYLDGAFHIIRDGRVVQRAPQPHPVLLIGYDVYCQDPAETIGALERAGFDLSTLHQTEWNGRPVYIVGADEGDEATSQFWIDAERLLCLRIINRRPSGAVIDIQFTDYEPFAGAWLCTELIFYRDGTLLIYERDLEHSIPASIDPKMFAP